MLIKMKLALNLNVSTLNKMDLDMTVDFSGKFNIFFFYYFLHLIKLITSRVDPYKLTHVVFIWVCTVCQTKSDINVMKIFAR